MDLQTWQPLEGQVDDDSIPRQGIGGAGKVLVAVCRGDEKTGRTRQHHALQGLASWDDERTFALASTGAPAQPSQAVL